MVEMMISPVGLGNQFLFHSGGGEPLAPGSFVPVVGSDKAKALIRDGIAVEPQHDDSISVILNRAKTLMELLNEAFGEGGNDATEIGQIVGNIKEILAEAKELAGMVKEAFGEERSDATEIGQIVGSMQETLASAKTLSGMLTDAMGEGSDATKIGTIVGYADSALANLGTITGPEGEVYVNLVESLKSLSSTLDSLDKTAAFIPGQLPQFMGIIMDLRTTLKTAEDVLVALTNNPLLRGGIPEKPQTQDGGISPWTIPF
jgi:phospholipid/cholesterol/gamma-HCH transport system substrate-binding protein